MDLNKKLLVILLLCSSLSTPAEAKGLIRKAATATVSGTKVVVGTTLRYAVLIVNGIKLTAYEAMDNVNIVAASAAHDIKVVCKRVDDWAD